MTVPFTFLALPEQINALPQEFDFTDVDTHREHLDLGTWVPCGIFAETKSYCIYINLLAQDFFWVVPWLLEASVGKNHALFSRYFALQYRYGRLLGVILRYFALFLFFGIFGIFWASAFPSPWHRWLTAQFGQPWISMKGGPSAPTAAKSRPMPYESWQRCPGDPWGEYLIPEDR